MFFARLHYTEYERRKRAGELEYTWKAENEELFTSVLYRYRTVGLTEKKLLIVR